ncbi:MAG: glucose-6-phosphate isomerase [Alphaproteobacteria bacterium]|nr:glucose-6-phosphate isomerase [Alphaproteobacteria bacterium]
MSSKALENLRSHAKTLQQTPIAALFDDDTARAKNFSVSEGGLTFDYSRHKITTQTLQMLCDWLESRDFSARRQDLFSGGMINRSEGRAALHTALRSGGPAEAQAYVHAMLEKMKGAADMAAPYTDVVHLGIGGSDLGARLVCEALPRRAGAPRLHFLSSIDGSAVAAVMKACDPQRTLVIITSKSFTTQETMLNARAFADWLGAAKIKHNVWAVTAAPEKAHAFGIAPENVFALRDWIGGRFSLWSAAGLPIVLSAGFAAFSDLLAGAAAADAHFQNAPMARNIPVLMALIGAWYRDFFDYRAQAVLPYAHGLEGLVPYLQALEMESNGKGVDHDGHALSVSGAPLVFGGVGTQAQHAFFQWLHQGRDITPADFITVALADHDFSAHHRTLQANARAQADALMRGQSNAQQPHRHFPGDRPSSFITLTRLDARALGFLLAVYEHKIFTQGVLWNINSFDQWGVELGKTLADALLRA